jgi:hypothetical protein
MVSVADARICMAKLGVGFVTTYGKSYWNFTRKYQKNRTVDGATDS